MTEHSLGILVICISLLLSMTVIFVVFCKFRTKTTIQKSPVIDVEENSLPIDRSRIEHNNARFNSLYRGSVRLSENHIASMLDLDEQKKHLSLYDIF